MTVRINELDTYKIQCSQTSDEIKYIIKVSALVRAANSEHKYFTVHTSFTCSSVTASPDGGAPITVTEVLLASLTPDGFL